MKLLFDENISYRIIKKIKDSYPLCEHVTTIRPLLTNDLSIFYFARKEDFLIVTFDEDFREIQSINGFPQKIIWLRMGNTSTDNILAKIIDNLKEIADLAGDEEIGILEIY